MGSICLSPSSPSPAFYSEAKAASGGLLNGPLSYSQPSDGIKVSGCSVKQVTDFTSHTTMPFLV